MTLEKLTVGLEQTAEFITDGTSQTTFAQVTFAEGVPPPLAVFDFTVRTLVFSIIQPSVLPTSFHPRSIGQDQGTKPIHFSAFPHPHVAIQQFIRFVSHGSVPMLQSLAELSVVDVRIRENPSTVTIRFPLDHIAFVYRTVLEEMLSLLGLSG